MTPRIAIFLLFVSTVCLHTGVYSRSLWDRYVDCTIECAENPMTSLCRCRVDRLLKQTIKRAGSRMPFRYGKRSPMRDNNLEESWYDVRSPLEFPGYFQGA